MDIKVETNEFQLNGILTIPEKAKCLILFAHGSGSGRLSPRNQFVSKFLNEKGFATLLIDLLTESEEEVDNKTDEYRFNLEFLAKRLVKITEWARVNEETKDLKIGYFGASTGAGAALIAASKDEEIVAVVSRGGRPDMALGHLVNVTCPTLLIVGENDKDVIKMNEKAMDMLKHKKKLEIIPGATHLFEEADTLEQVAISAANWFLKNSK